MPNWRRFAEADPGISGVDTLLAMTLKLVHQGQLPLSTAIAALTTNPAAIIGIDAGHLGLGARADFMPVRSRTGVAA